MSGRGQVSKYVHHALLPLSRSSYNTVTASSLVKLNNNILDILPQQQGATVQIEFQCGHRLVTSEAKAHNIHFCPKCGARRRPGKSKRIY